MDKKNYVLHYRNLKLYLEMGMKLKYVHRVVQFEQSPWLALYIEFNTQKRKESQTDFEKNLYKLFNNAIYGKLCEDLRKRVDVHIVSNQIQAERYVAKPLFDSFEIINEDLTMVKLRKGEIHWTKPTYVGFCVLELSKLVMYKFHYEYVVKKYNTNAKLLFTDTDSLCYEIRTDDIYVDMLHDKTEFDFSDYPVSHCNYDKSNCKVTGKMKDECNGVAAREFVGLRAKMYSLLADKEKKTAKGVKRNFVKQTIRHQMYVDCLANQEKTTASFYNLVSKNHTIATTKITKDALSPYDDKRYLLKHSTDTHAYGHYRIKKL